jgi:hypothetical protein
MKELAALVLVFASALSYFYVATQLALYQRWPVVHVLGCVLGVVWLAAILLKRRGGRRLYATLCLLVASALTALFLWYTLDFSTYDNRTAAVAVGEELGPRLAGVTLALHTGEPTPLLAPGDQRGTLLVFYRGFW